jgi:hypothetical protein
LLKKIEYPLLKKADKGVIHQYIEKVTGYSRAQVNQLFWGVPANCKIKPTDYPGAGLARNINITNLLTWQ